MKRTGKGRGSAISPIIATLLLILIAIASGVILYAYVQGFIGSSTQNTGVSQSTISIESSCVSKTTTTGCNGNGYYAVIRNLGTNTIATGSIVQVYLTDISSSSTGVTTFTLTGSIIPGGSATLTGNLPTFSGTTTAGDTFTFKVVLPDGGTATSTTKSF
jgi:archaeal type IV pilus assembly protein PilA